MTQVPARTIEDAYDTLGVPRFANHAAVRATFRSAALRLHPDKCRGDAAKAEQFKAVNEAYGAITHPDQRAAYTAAQLAAERHRSFGVTARLAMELLTGQDPVVRVSASRKAWWEYFVELICLTLVSLGSQGRMFWVVVVFFFLVHGLLTA